VARAPVRCNDPSPDETTDRPVPGGDSAVGGRAAPIAGRGV